MNKLYNWLVKIILIELGILFVLNKINFAARSFWGNAIGVLVCLLPFLILLFALSNDDKLSKNVRLCLKIIFGLIIFVYLLTTVVLIATGNY